MIISTSTISSSPSCSALDTEALCICHLSDAEWRGHLLLKWVVYRKYFPVKHSKIVLYTALNSLMIRKNQIICLKESPCYVCLPFILSHVYYGRYRESYDDHKISILRFQWKYPFWDTLSLKKCFFYKIPGCWKENHFV